MRNSLICILMMAFPFAASAADTSTSSSSSEAASGEKTKYLGDKLSFPVIVRGKYVDADGTAVDDGELTLYNLDSADVCIPEGLTLKGIKDLDDGSINVRVSRKYRILDKIIGCNEKILNRSLAINIPAEIVNNYKPNVYGLTYGGLVIPYKYQFHGSKELQAGGSIGPYVGYKWDKNYSGFEIKTVAFGGASMIEVSQDVDGEQKSQTLSGLSYGIGLLGEVKESFQFGIVFGQDKVSKSSNYVDNGKTWVAFSIGVSFDEKK